MNLFFLRRLWRSIWFRPAIFSLASVLTIALTPLAARFIPSEWMGWIDDGAVERTLDILASSLLAVAIFALATMFQAFQAAAQAATPRARPLMTQDRTAQNAISTFVGAFLFSLLALIGLSSGLYAQADIPVLFVLTLLLVGVVVFALIRWIERLSDFGGVEEAILAIETATREAIASTVKSPAFGGTIAERPPSAAEPVAARKIGYVQSVDGERLAAIVRDHGIAVHVEARPGRFVGPGRPIAFASTTDEKVRDLICQAFVLAPHRSFEEDPRFGFVTLSEIASRALSAAVNDPGTAISVLAAEARLFSYWSDLHRSAEPCPQEAGLTARPLDLDPVFRDAFYAIGRDGAAHVEVAMRLQRVLAMLCADDADRYAAPARRQSERALAFAEAGLTVGDAYESVRTVAPD